MPLMTLRGKSRLLYRDPFSQCTMHCAGTYLVLASVPLSLSQLGWCIFWGPRVRKYFRIVGSLGRLGCFRNGREKNSTRSIRQHTIETAIKRAQIHVPDTVVASVDTQGGKLTGLDGCLFGANGGFHPRRVENRLLALLRASTT